MMEQQKRERSQKISLLVLYKYIIKHLRKIVPKEYVFFNKILSYICFLNRNQN